MTNTKPHEVWPTLERLLAGEITLAAFEAWLFASADLERVVGSQGHMALMSFNFRQPHAIIELNKIVRQLYDEHRPGCLARDRAHRLAVGLIDGTIELQVAVRALSRLYNEGNHWVPIIFVGIDSELDAVPSPEQQRHWAPEALETKLKELEPLVEHWRQGAIQAAKELLQVT